MRLNVITLLVVISFAFLGLWGYFPSIDHAPLWWLYPSAAWTFALFIQQIPHLWVKCFGSLLSVASAMFCVIFFIARMFL
ncbi:hypothetical protein [Alteribacter aurantiacus]|uniref:hypothetical protein n=1 Tax=Alteribacter aurantiacus TaxID=254410 RepID=UPI0004191585|nr:hypothetical protein [Alteribacter aurantiacus]